MSSLRQKISALNVLLVLVGVWPGLVRARVVADRGGRVEVDLSRATIGKSTVKSAFPNEPFTLADDPVQVEPAITLQPVSQIALAGNSVTLVVAGSGAPPPRFQWRRNDLDLAGETADTLFIPNAQEINAGRYEAVGTSSAGTVTSVPAFLAMVPPPGDFDADYRPDLLWQNTSSGERRISLMNGTDKNTDIDLGWLDTVWLFAGAADFNGDNQPDILLQNSATGELGLWLMNHTAPAAYQQLGFVDTDWNIAGTADFNEDNQPDILWENAYTGERGIWFMHGSDRTGWASLGTLGTQWSVAGIGDFNNDNRPDIVLQNTLSGERKIWFLDGIAKIGETSLGFVAL